MGKILGNLEKSQILELMNIIADEVFIEEFDQILNLQIESKTTKKAKKICDGTC